MLVCLYVIYGRFRFASYIRRERVVLQQVNEYKRVMYELLSFEDEIALELKMEKATFTINRVFENQRSDRGFFSTAIPSPLFISKLWGAHLASRRHLTWGPPAPPAGTPCKIKYWSTKVVFFYCCHAGLL